MRVASWLGVVLGMSVGCGSAPPPRAAHGEPEPVVAPIATEEDGAPVIQRAALDEVLEGGIGLFLQRVGTEPDLREGRFVGFRVVELRDEALFAGLDLAPGDTIVQVNGQGIERPEHAFTVWTGLRVASELTIVVLRGEERRELRFPIVD